MMVNVILVIILTLYSAIVFCYQQNSPVIIANYSEQDFAKGMNDIYEKLLCGETQKARRVEKISQYFIGKPYILGALGEGKNGEFDKSPLYRTDAFDCATYVSTVLALAEANDVIHFEKILKKIQYHAKCISYTNRNHFFELEWNQKNQQLGYIKDITHAISINCREAVALVDKRKWFENAGYDRIKLLHPVSSIQAQKIISQLHCHAFVEKQVVSRVKYIPVTTLFIENKKNSIRSLSARNEIFARIPNASIIEIVDKNRHLKSKIGTDLNVVHLGFAIWKNQNLMFRSASSIYGKVVDIPLKNYLAQSYLLSTHPEGIGINIQKILGT